MHFYFALLGIFVYCCSFSCILGVFTKDYEVIFGFLLRLIAKFEGILFRSVEFLGQFECYDFVILLVTRSNDQNCFFFSLRFSP